MTENLNDIQDSQIETLISRYQNLELVSPIKVFFFFFLIKITPLGKSEGTKKPLSYCHLLSSLKLCCSS